MLCRRRLTSFHKKTHRQADHHDHYDDLDYGPNRHCAASQTHSDFLIRSLVSNGQPATLAALDPQFTPVSDLGAQHFTDQGTCFFDFRNGQPAVNPFAVAVCRNDTGCLEDGEVLGQVGLRDI